MSNTTSETAPGLKQRFLHEMKEYAFISVYLWICFTALLLFKTSILETQDLPVLPMGAAAIKALIIGKFILLGKAAKVGVRVTPQILLHKILWKSLAFLLLLVAFSAIEEIVVGLIHGQTLAATSVEFSSKSFIEVIAPVMVMLLVLIPLMAFEELDRALDNISLRKLLLERPDSV